MKVTPFLIHTVFYGATIALPLNDIRSGRNAARQDGLDARQNLGGLGDFSIPIPLPTALPTDGLGGLGGGFSIPTALPTGLSGGLGGGLPGLSAAVPLPTGGLAIPETRDVRSDISGTRTVQRRWDIGDLTGSSTDSGLGSLTSGLGDLGSSDSGLGSLLGSSTSSGLGSLASGLTGILRRSWLGRRDSTTENGVVDNDACTGLTVIFARGTSEAGNVGSIAGPPMFSSLRTKLGQNNVTVQGVDYDASIAGNAELGQDGSATMIKMVNLARSQCPNSKIVISGYSQGAMVTHVTAKSVSADAAVVFGDPFNGEAVGNISTAKTLDLCAPDDVVCGTATTTTGVGHLSYGEDADTAASFIVNATGV